MITKKGLIYEGEIENGQRNGFGRFIYAGGISIIGFWKNDA